ncbi:S-type pyocin domain-containing protein, partial [Pseudomonas sp. P5_A2_2]
MAQRQSAFKVEADRSFAARSDQLASSLDGEVLAARRPPDINPSERWQLYLITREKIEIDGLIARKAAEFNAQGSLARSFDGHDPLVRSTSDYMARLDQFGDALDSGHQAWETAYNAAHEAQLLSAQIKALTERSATLSVRHAEQTIAWREREGIWERHRQVAEQRDARVRFKQQADADIRIERVKQANTYRLAVNPSVPAVSTLAIPGSALVAGAADALAIAVSRSVVLLGEVAGTLATSQVAIFVGGIAYPSELGNGELTPEQRARLFHAVAVPAHALELHDSRELQAIADAGGSVAVEYRLKPVVEAQGTAIIVASTGAEIDSRVPVVNAALDPLTGVYTAEVPGSPTRYVEFAPDSAPQAQVPNPQPLAVTQPQTLGIPAGVDWRIQDCIVCVPGLEPIYLSFNTPPMGAGVVTGTGQPVTTDWWKAATQPVGAAIPTLIGDQFRGREFTSFEAFDEALWRTLGEHHEIVSQFDEVNQKRLEQGYAPYAPKSTWAGENREFELRYQERPGFWSDPFNLDQISIKTPSNT